MDGERTSIASSINSDVAVAKANTHKREREEKTNTHTERTKANEK
jgi:hypothetical protein